MDESGFAVGTSQASRALVNLREKTSWKKIQGRQEWITAIDVVDAAGIVGPPLLIFKSMLSSGWIPENTPPDWRFSTSKSGWTTDSHGYEWLTTVFEPWSRQRLPNPHARRLLVMDGHSSHITANVISFCVHHDIDLVIMPPRCSHVLQPLDVSVFAPLKRALAEETDRVARLDAGCVGRVQWTEMYLRAHAKAFSASNIRNGWRATGLYPFSPFTVVDKINGSILRTPLAIPANPLTSEIDLDVLLLDSSPLDGAELRQANAMLVRNINAANDLTPRAKRYTARMTEGFEKLHAEMVTLRKQRDAQTELLQTRKRHNKGKRALLQNRFVFSTPEVLITIEAETGKVKKEGAPKIGMSQNETWPEDDKNEDGETLDTECESSVIVVAHPRRA